MLRREGRVVGLHEGEREAGGEGTKAQRVMAPLPVQGNDRREVKQFHYTGWPDFGVPDHPHPVIAFIRRINNFKRTTSGPDIIHCRWAWLACVVLSRENHMTITCT